MACDPFWNKTVLALKFDGTNGSTTFTDEKGHTLTANGNAQISTAQSKFGGASGYFDGNGDYLSIPSSSDFYFGTGDFSIDFWFYSSASFSATAQTFCGSWGSGSNYAWIIQATSTSVSIVFTGDVARNFAWTTPSTGAWNHFAVARSGSSLRAYLNGVQIGTTLTDSTNIIGTAALEIGRNADGNQQYFNGYIDALRITKAARYIENFTPDTAIWNTNQCVISGVVKDATNANAKRLVRTLRRDSAEVVGVSLSDATTGAYSHAVETTGECMVIANDGVPTDPFAANVVLALKMAGANGSTTFTDDAGHTTTPNGDVRLVADAFPYGRSAAYFDGTGDYIACAYSTDYEVGSGDFTVEFWFKVPNVSGQKTMFAFQTDYHFGIFLNGNRMNCFASSNGSSWSPISGDTNGNLGAGYTDVTANVWHHFAWVRSGTTWTMYLDGKIDRQLTGISGEVVTRNEALNIGRWGNGSLMLTGFIKDFRLTKTARYSAPFALPLPDFIPALTAGTENAVVLDRVLPV